MKLIANRTRTDFTADRGAADVKNLGAFESSPLSRKLSAFVALLPQDKVILERLQQRCKTYVTGRDIVHQGQAERAAYILSAGWVCSYKILPNGARQVIDFQIPGDFLGLRSILLRTSDYSFEPIGNIQAAEVATSELIGVFAQSPRLATAILWAISRDEAMVVEHLVCLGRRDAEARMAHLLLELAARLALVGMASRAGYFCPLTQTHIADALGLSAVHVNRVLRQLRESGLVTFQNGKVTFDNYDGLTNIAEFDPQYLDQIGPLLK
ncbi:MAG: Crp/Fnr family transcriptional regulator [Alphaproteobacteria bacterium]